MEEFEYIAKNFPEVHEVVIEDDTFTANKERVIKICELLEEKKLTKRLKWLCNARVNICLLYTSFADWKPADTGL